MSVFEALMMICFGAAWPFSIYKSYKSKSNKGKSLWFLFVVILGYAGGIIHKILYNMDYIIILYALNMIMVSIDACLYFRNGYLEKYKKNN
ncbi:MAG: hypothetical protein LBQ47_01635 [Endomicrobium sp.]|jgi:hypothetical protein|nr:hypothetical protein [Endomicrobium sp.]